MSGQEDELLRAFGRVEGTLAMLIEQIKARDGAVDEKVKTLDKRMGKVERRQYWFSGAGTILGAIAGVFVDHRLN